MPVRIEETFIERGKFTFDPGGNPVTFTYRKRVGSQAKLDIDTMPYPEKWRYLIMACVESWEGVENQDGTPRPYSYTSLQALGFMPGWEQMFGDLAVHLLQNTNGINGTSTSKKNEPSPTSPEPSVQAG